MPRVTCPECEATIRISDDAPAGKKVRCPKCEAVFRPDVESENADETPRRRSRSEGGSSARKTPAVLVVVPAIAAALLVYGGTVAGVIVTEKKKNKDESQAFQTLAEGVAKAKVKAPIDAGPAPQPKGNQTVGLEVGNTAPDIVGEDIDGQQFKLSDYRGKVVVIDFWGHW